MAYSAKEVANYFLDLARLDGLGIDAMKMQKLIYFAHGWYLAVMDKRLIYDRIEAWNYGPVIPVIYNEFKEFGRNHINRYANISDGNQAEKILSDDPDVKETIKFVWDTYKNYTSVQLSNLTHEEDTPWDLTRKRYPGSHNPLIADELIKRHYAL